MSVLRPLFVNYINIFHKTVQIVILRCWMGLYLNWFKSYDTNEKKKMIKQNTNGSEITSFFLQNRKKLVREIFVAKKNCWKTAIYQSDILVTSLYSSIKGPLMKYVWEGWKRRKKLNVFNKQSRNQRNSQKVISNKVMFSLNVR